MHARVITLEELAQATQFGDMVPVYKVDAKTVVKTGDCVRVAEAEALKLIHEKTTIPVPKVYSTYTDKATGHVCIVMKYIEGDCLADVWNTLDSDQKQDIIKQLGSFVSQLRKMKGSFIGSVDGTACEDQLFTVELGGYGPYKDEEALNGGIITALRRTIDSGWANTVVDMIASLKDHEIVMTHGDLCPRNIIVQGSKVAAIVDWEMSGFYPEYWEYVKALYMPAWESQWVKDRAVDKIMKPYRMELAMLRHARTIVW